MNPLVAGHSPRPVVPATQLGAALAARGPTVRSGAHPLTHEGGPIAVTRYDRDLFCLLSDGSLLVLQGDAQHPLVRSFESRCRTNAENGDAKCLILHCLEVSAERLQEIYKSGSAITRAITVESDSTQLLEFVALVRHAVKLGASDIHIRVNERSTQVFMRIDGLLTPNAVKQGSAAWGTSLAQAIFHSMTDVSGTNYTPAIPQDAMVRSKIELPKEISSIRIATLPRNAGTNVLSFRLFYRANSEAGDLDGLGYEPSQMEIFHRITSKPYGILIITGPTGSGKTTTLQVALTRYIKRTGGTQNIIMIEDPTEIEVPGAIQTSVMKVGDDERAAAYRNVIRAAMRSDPDVMMISEMRDLATADAALAAAMTGHFVFTTLHANNAFGAIPRLERMGIPGYLLYDHNIVGGIVAQRLVRKLCQKCALPIASKEALAQYGQKQISRLFTVPAIAEHSDSVRLRNPDGCAECNHRGSKGRICVAEIVEMDATLAHPFKNNNPDLASVIWREVRGNMNMKDSALLHVIRGKSCPLDAEKAVGTFTDFGDTINFEEIDRANSVYSQRGDRNQGFSV